MNQQEHKPLNFGQTLAASACGFIVVSLLGAVVMLACTVATMAALSSMGRGETATVKDKTFVSIDLGRISGDRTQNRLQQAFGDGGSIGLTDATAAIRAAESDNRVLGLIIKDPGTSSISWASMQELRQAVSHFAQSGKPVLSYATGYSQSGYYLCSAADVVALHPSGMIDFRGMGAQVMYYKDLLDKLGVEMQLIRPESCSYKSAGEVYTLNHMSPANREQIRAYIGSIWNTATADIAASRGLAVSQLNHIADNLSGYLASDALASHLADTLCFEDDMRQLLKERYNARHMLPIERYASGATAAAPQTGNAIAVIYAEGNVVDGSARGFADAVYADDIVKALRQATQDPDVKAIVLRVNSPGGSATASESMTHAVMQARDVKPVVVSMGDVAASAGYEMSCMAHLIVAQPTTVTGSIGVFGTLPNVGRMLKQKLGIAADTVATNRNATGLSVMRPLSPAAMAMMNRNVEDFYKTFVGRVAQGRNMTPDQVHAIARGRVWTGADAMRLGLVDTLGGLDLAIQLAAQRAGIDTYRTVAYPKERDIWSQLATLAGDDEGEVNLLARMQLAWLWRAHRLPQPPTRWQQDLAYIAQAQGLQARLPFIFISE